MSDSFIGIGVSEVTYLQRMKREVERYRRLRDEAIEKNPNVINTPEYASLVMAITETEMTIFERTQMLYN